MQQFIADGYTTITNAIMAATREDLVAVCPTPGGYFLFRSAVASPEAIGKLKNYKTVLIICNGKLSKMALNKNHKEWYSQEVKRINNFIKN